MHAWPFIHIGATPGKGTDGAESPPFYLFTPFQGAQSDQDLCITASGLCLPCLASVQPPDLLPGEKSDQRVSTSPTSGEHHFPIQNGILHSSSVLGPRGIRNGARLDLSRRPSPNGRRGSPFSTRSEQNQLSPSRNYFLEEGAARASIGKKRGQRSVIINQGPTKDPTQALVTSPCSRRRRRTLPRAPCCRR